MICKNDVAVDASGKNREATHVVGVYLAAGFNPDVEFLGMDDRELADNVQKGVKGDCMRIFLRGPDAFARLCEVSFE